MSDPPHAAPCPVCTDALVAPQTLTVCADCYNTLQASGAVAVHATGEFPAMAQLLATPRDPGSSGGRSRSPTFPAEVRCSMCDKAGDEVKKLVMQRGVRICNECVALCATVFAAELGDDWGAP